MFRFDIGRRGGLASGVAWLAVRLGPLSWRAFLEYDLRGGWAFGLVAGLLSRGAYAALHLGFLDVSLEAGIARKGASS